MTHCRSQEKNRNYDSFLCCESGIETFRFFRYPPTRFWLFPLLRERHWDFFNDGLIVHKLWLFPLLRERYWDLHWWTTTLPLGWLFPLLRERHWDISFEQPTIAKFEDSFLCCESGIETFFTVDDVQFDKTLSFAARAALRLRLATCVAGKLILSFATRAALRHWTDNGSFKYYFDLITEKRTKI